MSSPVISVRGLGKKYRMGFTHSHDMLRDKIASSIKLFRPRSCKNGNSKPEIRVLQPNVFWALRNISFDVQPGEVLGVIGANGAGKSTLLKLLSEITEPTEGEIRIKGRVSSLLEIGTGFHPELSGRENIFMNGAILGMTRAEIKAKFDEIVAFAEVEKFIDTPVKRYSSGMQVRLAFAVAAHLEPEILLVDEVLAVGDASFQRKCLGKMQDVSRGGRTVLFISHNMQVIRQLTSRCILLESGNIIFNGDKNECISKYMESVFADSSSCKEFQDREASEERPVCIKGVSLSNGNGIYKNNFFLGEKWVIEIQLESIFKRFNFQASLNIYNEFGIYVYHFVSWDTGQEFFTTSYKSHLKVTIPKLLLYPGQYGTTLWVGYPGASSREIDKIQSAISFSVDQPMGIDVVPRKVGKGSAIVHYVPNWDIETE